MGDLKTKIVDGITPNFESTDSKDFVGILNKIAEAMGGVTNMGVFADITQITLVIILPYFLFYATYTFLLLF